MSTTQIRFKKSVWANKRKCNNHICSLCASACIICHWDKNGCSISRAGATVVIRDTVLSSVTVRGWAQSLRSGCPTVVVLCRLEGCMMCRQSFFSITIWLRTWAALIKDKGWIFILWVNRQLRQGLLSNRNPPTSFPVLRVLGKINFYCSRYYGSSCALVTQFLTGVKDVGQNLSEDCPITSE